jgi:pyruvate,water dikinase
MHAQRLASLDVDDVAALAKVGGEIRGWIVADPLPAHWSRNWRRLPSS